jgi:hypothetical protein
MNMRILCEQDRLEYDTETGVFIWINPPENKHYLKGGIAGGEIDPRGYLRVRVNGRPHRQHRLAWSVGHGLEIPDNMEVNHRNGIKWDNRLINLELSTRKSNMEHAWKFGLNLTPPKPIVGVNRTTGEGWFFRSAWEATKFGFQRAAIQRCLRGHSSHHRNYSWEYV